LIDLIEFIFLATYYPDDGTDPIPGTVKNNSDGSIHFTPRIASSLPKNPSTGQIKIGDGSGEHGTLTPLGDGTAVFKPNDGKIPGRCMENFSIPC